MAEYIEREAARTLIKNYGKGAIADGMKALDPVDDIISLAGGIDLIPAADVAPVRHGRWTTKRTPEHDGEPHCSECGIEPYRKNDRELPNCCPNCGAEMDLEVQHE